jgi:6,7-dimethyl-8-ribityllumazine synthase
MMADARRATLKDQADISGARALIVEARFYDDIQDALLDGAVAELKQAGVGHDVVTVPGALEIPAAIAIALDAAERSGKPYDAVIALGCVVRGDTIHFEIVAMESSRALMDLSVQRRVPLGNGIVTVNTDAQAWARARVSELNKGGDAARAALAMLRIKRRLAKAYQRDGGHQTNHRQEGQQARRGAARRGAGAVSDGDRRRGNQRHLRGVRKPLARQRSRRR